MDAASAEHFPTEWKAFHGETKPVSWVLREAPGLPWVRFHALPRSKRYASNGKERRIILDRANSLAERILGEGTDCWLVHLRIPASKPIGVLAGHYSDDHFSEKMEIRVEALIWRRGGFDALLQSIAVDTRKALWMNRRTGAIFASYDGGFDLFPPSFEEVGRLKAERAEWLSFYPGGL